jgi:hypothetical protein
MSVTLAEAAKLSNNDLQRGVIETFLLEEESVILDRIPLLEVTGNAYAYNEEASLPGVEFRAVNAGYTESTGTFNQKTEKLVIMGGDADVDIFIEKTRSNLNDQRASQERMKVKAATFKFQDTFINGNVEVDANSFDGLKKRLTGGQVITAATNGAEIVGTTEETRFTFYELLDQLCALVLGGPDALYMNKFVMARLKSAARRTGHYETSRDEFGKVVESFNGIAMVDIGNKGDGTMIIPQTETTGTSSATSSIYAVRFGEDEGDRAVTGLIGDQGVDVRDLGEIQEKPVYRTRIEMFTGLAVFGPGAARLAGILNK